MPLFVCLATLGLLAASAAAETRYILQADSSEVSNLAARYGFEVVRTAVIGHRPVALVRADAPLPESVLDMLAREPSVSGVHASPDIALAEVAAPATGASLAAIQDALAKPGPADFYGHTVRLAYVDQAATALIATEPVHKSYAIGAGIVAVIDTGVDPVHPALRDALIPGYDFTRDEPGIPSEWLDLPPSASANALAQSTVAILDQKNTPMLLNQSTVAILDQSTVAILDGQQLPSAFGHGTMVAGLIHRVAPGARIMPLKAFHSDGSSDLFQIVRAIYYAVDHGARVINMSFSFTEPHGQVEEAVQYAASHGVFCVASLGNQGTEATFYPAAYHGVFGVGSTAYDDRRSSFSNYGRSAYTAAPGEALITAYPGNNYAAVWGTSFSAALVSGGLALVLDVQPDFTLRQMADLLNHGQHLDGEEEENETHSEEEEHHELGEARLHLLKMFLSLTRPDHH